MSKIETHDSAMSFVVRRMTLLNNLIQRLFYRESWDEVTKTFLSDPLFTKNYLIQNFGKSNDDKLREVMRRFSVGSNIIVVLGEKGYGKSATVNYIMHGVKNYLEAFGLKRRVVYVGPKQVQDPHFTYYTSTRHTRPGDIVVIDEAGIIYNARGSGTKDNQEMNNSLKILRHAKRGQNEKIIIIWIFIYAFYC